MDTAQAADATRCPLCGGPNGCAMERQKASGEPQPPCWCTRVEFRREVLESIPAPARGRACVCQACATRDAR